MIHQEQKGSVAIVRMEHGKVNALDLELLQELHGRFDELKEARGVRAVVLTGSGRSFSAGVDLFRILEGGRGYIEPFMEAFRDVLRQMAEYPKPIVAALNGHAIAGGCVLACACDWRIMVRGDGKIGVPELQVGVPFPGLAWELLCSAVSLPTARRLALSGELLSPEDAAALGLVDELAEPERFEERARERAERLGRISPDAYRVTKRQLHPLREAPGREEEALAVWCASETHEAIRAYLERTLGKRS